MEKKKIDNSGFGPIGERSKEEPQALRLIPYPVGNGATCNTYKAKAFGKLLFVKELKPELASDTLMRSAFRKEQELGLRLDHPGLPRYVYVSGWLPTHKYVAMEFIDGLTLDDFIRKYPDFFSNSKNVVNFISDLVEILDYLHSNQVLHLDLKPSNIMLTRVGHKVKLIDLGFAVTDSITDSAGHTPGFVSPERLEGKADLNEGVDFYGVGKILEFIRRATPKFPVRKFRNLEQKLLSSDVNRRPRSKDDVMKLTGGNAAWRKPLLYISCAAAILVLFLMFGRGVEVSDPSISRIALISSPSDSIGSNSEQATDSISQIIPEESPSRPQEVHLENSSPVESTESNRSPAVPIAPAPSIPKAETGVGESKNLRQQMQKMVIDNIRKNTSPIINKVEKKIAAGALSKNDYYEIQDMVNTMMDVVLDSKQYETAFPALSEQERLEILYNEFSKETKENLDPVLERFYNAR